MTIDNTSYLPMGLDKTPGIRDLPVVEILNQVAEALEIKKRAVLQAPPGAGKTTLVPLALMNQPWLRGKKIIMLEPRRLAARACAAHMAGLLGEKTGQTIGHQVRMDRCIGPKTRVEVITEGILTRRIQNDPGLEGVGLLIFDEFHERHIHSDLGLALALESAEVFNPELRLLVMSATMDIQALSAIMDQAPMISSKGRAWPVTTHYLPPRTNSRQTNSRQIGSRNKGFDILPTCLDAVSKALDDDQGDILVFLPGAAQIRAMEKHLAQSLRKNPDIAIHPLYGNLSPKDQAAAIAPAIPGQRKIVLATPIAETSLTIQGVRVVVDSGLARSPRFSPGRGMTRLETVTISKASADQRQGRAGRTAPGVCYRLWSAHETQGLVPFNRPEILSTDLTSLALELASWGVRDPGELNWLDLPPESAFAPAVDLLKQLRALDDHSKITPHGNRLLAAGSHPRLAHMIIEGIGIGQGFMACCLAALVEERDFIVSQSRDRDPDLGLRLEILTKLNQKKHQNRGNTSSLGQDIHYKRAKTILANAQNLAKRMKIKGTCMDIPMAGRVLAFAWPERVAKKRATKSLSYVMASGNGAFFRSANPLSSHPFIVAVEVDGNPKNAGIFLAAPYDAADLARDFPEQVHTDQEVAWDSQKKSVRSFSRTWYGKLMLKENQLSKPDPVLVQSALIKGIDQSGLGILPWTRPLKLFRQRVIFLKTKGQADPMFDSLPDLCDSALESTLDVWLAPFLNQVMSAASLKKIDLGSALKNLLTWDQQQLVERHAPTHLRVPSGSNIPLQYMDDTGSPLEFPILAVRLQEMFGQTTTPAIARSRIPVTLHLLSPAGRPVQITRDLANFWAATYTQVKKDLMGRYPKHYWPEDPLSAEPTHRAKPRKP